MARVPEYSRQVTEQALPGVRQQRNASPALFAGNQLAGNAGKVLDSVGDFALQLQQKEDAALTAQAEADFLEQTTDFKLNARKREGLDATGLPEEADKFYTDFVADTVKNAPNGRVGAAMELIAAKHRPGFHGYIGAHSAEQLDKATEISSQAAIAAQIKSASADPAQAATAKLRIIATVRSKGLESKYGADAEKAAIQEELTGLHQSVLGTLMATNQPDEAKAYFFSNKKDMVPDVAAKLQKSVEISGMLQQAQQGADGLMDEVRAGVKTFADATAEARKKYSGELREEVLGQLKSQESDRQAAEDEIEDKVMEPINTMIGDYTQSGRTIPKRASKPLLTKMLGSPEAYLKATQAIDAHNDEIIREGRATRNYLKAQNDNSKDKKINDLLLLNDMTTNPDKYKNQDMKETLIPLAKEGHISTEAVKKAIVLQGNLRDPKQRKEMFSLVTGSQYLNQRLQASIIGGDDFSSLNKTEQADIKSRALLVVEPLLAEYQARVGEKATKEEVKQIVDTAFTDRKVRSTFLGVSYGDVRTRTDFEPTEARNRAGQIIRVPEEWRRKIEKALIKNGQQPTAELVQQYYLAQQK